jgi:hypothetical protein
VKKRDCAVKRFAVCSQVTCQSAIVQWQPRALLSGEKSPASLRGWLKEQPIFLFLFSYSLPVPVSFDVCGLPTALSDTCNVPVSVPTPVGANTTSMVQLPEEVSCVWHVVDETLKGPVVEIERFLSITLWLFFRVNTFAALDFPTTVAEYVAVAGVNVACASPVPDRDTVCGLFVPLSLIERVPVRGPIWVGVKVTLIVQLFPAAKVLPQVLVCV